MYYVSIRSKLLAGNYALIDLTNQKIYVADGMGQDVTRKKLFHELVHGFDEWADEAKTNFLENHLFPFLTDPRNEQIIDFLTGRTK